MTDATIERVAGVLLNVQDNLPPDNPWGHRYIADHKGDTHRGDCTKMPFTCCRCVCDDAMREARTAIEAMRVPTEDMIDAGKRILINDDSATVERAFRVMIAAALGNR